MPVLLSKETWMKIAELLRATGIEVGTQGRRSSPARWVIVQCDSETPLDTDTYFRNQVYPATVINTATNLVYPDEETNLENLYGVPVLLTVLAPHPSDDTKPIAVVPQLGKLYMGPLLSEVTLDASGSISGRSRVVAIETNFQLDIGTGTDDHVPTWDGTGVQKLKDSLVTIDSFGSLVAPQDVTSVNGDIWATNSFGGGQVGFRDGTVSSPPPATATLAGFFGAVILPTRPYVALYNKRGTTLWTGFIQLIADEDSVVGPYMGTAYFVDFGSGTSGDEGHPWVVGRLGICDGSSDPVLGDTGTLGPGATCIGGMIDAKGSGSFVGTATPNTFTAPQSFIPTNPADIPILIQGAVSQSANLLEFKNSGGTLLVSVSPAGLVTSSAGFSGPGGSLTGLNASQLTTGTIPSAAIGTVDGGTF